MCTFEYKVIIVSSATLTLRLPVEVRDQLDSLAAATNRTKSYLAGEAIRQYLGLEIWQIGEIQQALNEADAGDFASDTEVSAVMDKYAS